MSDNCVQSDRYEPLCPHLTSDSEATGHKQKHQVMALGEWLGVGVGVGCDGRQEGSAEVGMPCPALSRAASFPCETWLLEVSLLPLALEVWHPRASQACLSTVILEWLQPVLRLSKTLLRFLPHCPQTSCPPFHSCLCHSGNRIPLCCLLPPPRSVGSAPQNPTGQSLSRPWVQNPFPAGL